ncbi:hypothetical protein [Roseinatronobacter alkalisoli]|uniref:Biotin protein ligase C-terminal domain-containing protein n=1 Tax=Roseinatronobacter alkalisoli TaxID=3028235 RepID=A0ABT5T8E9_9RHOB|nr:hypothetical protein [Roseinatronobacter sp. HJB301]MDD7971400.1 hypothetical protein [Roseinatronobacter sp. HJB301]
MTEQYEQGAVCLNNGMTLPYVWVSLHLNARLEIQLLSEPRVSRERDRFAQEIVTLLKGFETVEAEHWIRFCTAAGQTTYGAVAQSWCKGATLAQVLDGGRAVLIMKPDGTITLNGHSLSIGQSERINMKSPRIDLN